MGFSAFLEILRRAFRWLDAWAEGETRRKKQERRDEILEDPAGEFNDKFGPSRVPKSASDPGRRMYRDKADPPTDDPP